MTLVTIQPEFINENYSIDQECIIEGCLMKCKNKSCITKNCCTDKKENNDTELAEVVTVDVSGFFY